MTQAVVASGAVATYTYQGSSTDRVRSVLGATTTNYAFGPYGPLAQKVGATSPSYFLKSLHGDVVGLAQAGSTTVTGPVNFDPWGNPVGTPGTSFGFQGDPTDQGTGLVQTATRLYDPSMARFNTQDVLFGSAMNPGSMNQYGYVSNSPIANTDLSGMGCLDGNGHTVACTQVVEGLETNGNLASQPAATGYPLPGFPGDIGTECRYPPSVCRLFAGDLVGGNGSASVSGDDVVNTLLLWLIAKGRLTVQEARVIQRGAGPLLAIAGYFDRVQAGENPVRAGVVEAAEATGGTVGGALAVWATRGLCLMASSRGGLLLCTLVAGMVGGHVGSDLLEGAVTSYLGGEGPTVPPSVPIGVPLLRNCHGPWDQITALIGGCL